MYSRQFFLSILIALFNLTPVCCFAIKEITTKSQYRKALASKKPAIIKFYSDSCGPCKTMAPIYKKLAAKYQNKVDFYSMNTERNPYVVSEKQILGIPTIIYNNNGKEVSRDRGGMTRPDLENSITRFLQQVEPKKTATNAKNTKSNKKNIAAAQKPKAKKAKITKKTNKKAIAKIKAEQKNSSNQKKTGSNKPAKNKKVTVKNPRPNNNIKA